MDSQDFMRFFKKNDESWTLMVNQATHRESQIFDSCHNYVEINNDNTEKTNKNVSKDGEE